MASTCIYTIAIDSPGNKTYAMMAKILISSLLRSYFSGELILIHNTPTPLFRINRTQLTENMLPSGHQIDGKRLKFQARKWINAEYHDWVCFLDCDMLAQRNIDHLFDPGADCDILWQPEGRMTQAAYNSYFQPEEFPRLWRHGANSGSFAVRGEHYHEVMEEWERIDASEPVREKILVDQPAWNRLLFDTKLRTRQFEKDEIMFPLLHHFDYRKWRNAALIHANGTTPDVKLEFLLSQYLGRFAGHAEMMLALMDM